jgi:phosphoserine phosphatase RsbU/P
MENRAIRILVADHQEENRSFLAQHLESQGYEVQVASSGQETLDFLHRRPFNLLLLGLALPDMTSEQVMEHMNAHAHLQTMRVLLMSTGTDDDCLAECLRLGADDFVQLPSTTFVLDTRIKVCLENISFTETQEVQLVKAEKLADLMERVILPMGIALSTETNFDRLLERILLETKAVCNADAGTLYMRTEDDHLRFAIVVTTSLDIKLGGTSGNPVNFPLLPLYNRETGEPNHHNVASHVALTGKSINIPNIYEADGFDFSAAKRFDEQNDYRTVSSLAVPLKDNNGQVVGVLQLLNALDDDGHIIPFDDYSRVVVEFMSSQAAIVLNNHLLIQHKQKMYKLENDIQIARTIQSNFLPTKMPQVPGWEISAFFQPARDIAGDFYDVFKVMNNQKLGFVIADVCDKGVGAALFMSLSRSLLRAFVIQPRGINPESVSPDELTPDGELDHRVMTAKVLQHAVSNTNNYITEHHLDLNMFVTTFFGIIDPTDGTLMYINGGHCPPFILDSQGRIKARLEPLGPAVGMFPDAEFQVGEAHLDPGDFLFAFTDGIPDARNELGKLFTEVSLGALLQEPAESADELVSRVTSTITNHIGEAVQFDDITLLALRRE